MPLSTVTAMAGPRQPLSPLDVGGRWKSTRSPGSNVRDSVARRVHARMARREVHRGLRGDLPESVVMFAHSGNSCSEVVQLSLGSRLELSHDGRQSAVKGLVW